MKNKLHEIEWFATRDPKSNVCVLAKNKKTVRKAFEKLTGKNEGFDLDEVKLVFMIQEGE